MAVARDRFLMSKEKAVEHIKDSAKFIYNNAESLLGKYQYHRMEEMEIVIRISIDEAPTVSVDKNYITLGYNEGFHDGENGNEVGKA